MRSFEWSEFRKAARWGEPVLRRVRPPEQNQGFGSLICKIINPVGQVMQWAVRAEGRLRRQPPRSRGDLLDVRVMSSGISGRESAGSDAERSARQQEADNATASSHDPHAGNANVSAAV